MKKLLFSVFALAMTLQMQAKVKLQPMFSDNMVLQRNASAPIWGETRPGRMVSVVTSWNTKTYRAKADKQGRFTVSVDTPNAGGPYEITISDGSPIVLRNILIGEVWICSGQSNMEMPMQGWDIPMNAEEIAQSDRYTGIRLLHVEHAVETEPKTTIAVRNNGWVTCSPQTVKDFSATAFFFGKKINETERVPVGFWWHFADEYRQFRGLMDDEIIQVTIDGTKKMYDDLKPDMAKVMSDGFFGHPSIMENDINTIDDIKKIKSIGASSSWYDKQVDMLNEILKHFNGEIAAFYNIFAPLNYIRLYTECYKKRPELFAELFIEDPDAMLAASLEIAKDLEVLADKIKRNTAVDGIYYSVQSVQSKQVDINFHKRYVEKSDLQILNKLNIKFLIKLS